MVKPYDFRSFIGENWFQLGGCIATAAVLYTGMSRDIDSVNELQAQIISTQDAQSADIKDMKEDIAEIRSVIGTANKLLPKYEVSRASY